MSSALPLLSIAAMLLGPPPPGLEVHRLDLGDASELDAQAQAHEQRRARLPHRPHHRDLAELRIGEDVLVVADAARGLPEAVADLDHLVVLACTSTSFDNGSFDGSCATTAARY